MFDYFLFAIVPYLALGIFLVGSIYRYVNRGFQVSSLSSQFLEGRTLFWGSQPFHWGLVVLFFGHLIAFLFPRSVLAFNTPVRILILETTAFIFGLSAFWGLCVLIYRRFSNDRIRMVTSKMDIVVYIFLITQIVSGLMIAVFNRWGAGWFAAFLSPYLISIFMLSPNIEAISTVNSFWLKLHVVSAFGIIGVIPFSRFIHFLVYPLDYTWRSYQQVVWNWDRKDIRTSEEHLYGKKSNNN